jgi:HTH-type transcriptional regulator/antitoxin HigA
MGKMNASLRPARVVPPGRIIERELDARGWTQKDLAEIMGRPPQAINEIVRARKRITPETAYQLAEAFGTSPELWINLEAKYRLHLAGEEREDAIIAQKSRIYSRVPVSELIRRLWIRPTEVVDELEREVCTFLEIDSLDQEPQMVASFRHTPTREPELNAQIAWVQRVKHLARAQAVGVYNLTKLQAALPTLMSHAAEAEDVAKIPALLLSLGIHFVIVPHLEHTYLDGATFIHEGHPVVALTLRYDRIDSFWFTLLHELAHVVAGHEGIFLDNLDEQNGNGIEDEANRIARDWLIDPNSFASFVRVTQPYFSRAKILRYAQGSGRHPGIVLGRLQHDGLVPYRNLRALLVKVNPLLEAWIDDPGPKLRQRDVDFD